MGFVTENDRIGAFNTELDIFGFGCTGGNG